MESPQSMAAEQLPDEEEKMFACPNGVVAAMTDG
jgi:hypothetical protein